MATTSNKLAMRSGITTTLGVLLFAALALANYIAARHLLARWDLTGNKAYTVAPASRKVRAGLDDRVNVKLFFSTDLPDQGATIPQKVRDLLSELEAYSKGRLRVEEVDMSNEKNEAEAKSLGIPKQPLMGLDKNKVQTVEAYLGVAILYADKKEVLPSVLDTQNLEYDVTSAILRLTQPKKTVGFLTGHQERDPEREIKALNDQLRRQYQVDEVDLSGGKAVPASVTTLVVAGPRQPIDDNQRYQIDQFLMRGGNALFLIDMFDVDPGQMSVRPVDVGLTDQLARYGIRLKPAMTADWAVNEMVQVPTGDGMISIVQYALWPKIAPKYMSASNPMLNQISSLVLPWTASMTLVNDGEKKYEVEELASTSEYASSEDELFSANPSMLRMPDKSTMSKQTVIAAVQGPIKSFYEGKAVPAASAPSLDPNNPDAVPANDVGGTGDEQPRLDVSKGSQIVVVGGSEFVTDQMLRQRAFANNFYFVLNAIDWLTVGSDLIGIRSRQSGEPMLDPEKTEQWQKFVPWVNILLVPGLVAVAGLLRRSARRNRRVVLA